VVILAHLCLVLFFESGLYSFSTPLIPRGLVFGVTHLGLVEVVLFFAFFSTVIVCVWYNFRCEIFSSSFALVKNGREY